MNGLRNHHSPTIPGMRPSKTNSLGPILAGQKFRDLFDDFCLFAGGLWKTLSHAWKNGMCSSDGRGFRMRCQEKKSWINPAAISEKRVTGVWHRWFRWRAMAIKLEEPLLSQRWCIFACDPLFGVTETQENSHIFSKKCGMWIQVNKGYQESGWFSTKNENMNLSLKARWYGGDFLGSPKPWNPWAPCASSAEMILRRVSEDVVQGGPVVSPMN